MGTLSVEQVEHLMWDTVCCKNNREMGSEFSDITDESKLRGKSGVFFFSFCFFSFLFFFSFLANKIAQNSPRPCCVLMLHSGDMGIAAVS